MTSELLHQQYKRSERARRKNKQEERRMTHDIECRKGIRALHHLRIQMVTKEQRKVAEELERIKAGLRSQRRRPREGVATGRSRQPGGASPERGNNPGANSTNRPPWLATKSAPRLPVPGLTTYSGNVHQPHSKGLADSNRGSIWNRNTQSSRTENHEVRPQEEKKEKKANDSDEGSDDDDDDDSDTDDYDISDDDKDSLPDPEILKAIMQSVIGAWEETVVPHAERNFLRSTATKNTTKETTVGNNNNNSNNNNLIPNDRESKNASQEMLTPRSDPRSHPNGFTPARKTKADNSLAAITAVVQQQQQQQQQQPSSSSSPHAKGTATRKQTDSDSRVAPSTHAPPGGQTNGKQTARSSGSQERVSPSQKTSSTLRGQRKDPSPARSTASSSSRQLNKNPRRVAIQNRIEAVAAANICASEDHKDYVPPTNSQSSRKGSANSQRSFASHVSSRRGSNRRPPLPGENKGRSKPTKKSAWSSSSGSSLLPPLQDSRVSPRAGTNSGQGQATPLSNNSNTSTPGMERKIKQTKRLPTRQESVSADHTSLPRLSDNNTVTTTTPGKITHSSPTKRSEHAEQQRSSRPGPPRETPDFYKNPRLHVYQQHASDMKKRNTKTSSTLLQNGPQSARGADDVPNMGGGSGRTDEVAGSLTDRTPNTRIKPLRKFSRNTGLNDSLSRLP